MAKRASYLNSEQHVITGLIQGGEVTINSSTSINIAAGSAVFVDNTVIPVTQVEVTWNALTNITVPNIASTNISFVGVDVTGTPHFINALPTQTDKRDVTFLAAISHNDDVIAFITEEPIVAHDMLNVTQDLASLFNLKVISGGQLSSSGGLTIDINAANVFGAGINYRNDTSEPNKLTTASLNTATLQQIDKFGEHVGAPKTNVDVVNYDNNGVITALAGQSTIHRVYMSIDGHVDVLYGQNLYTDIDEAFVSLNADDSIIVIPTILKSRIFIGYVIASDATLDLSDTNQAILATASTVGTVSNASPASQIIVVPNETTDSEHSVIFTDGVSGDQVPNSDTGITYNPSTDTLTVGNVVGNLPAYAGDNATLTFTDPVADVLTVNDVSNNGVIVFTTTTASNDQTIPEPTTTGKTIVIANSSVSTDAIVIKTINSVLDASALQTGESIELIFDGTNWSLSDIKNPRTSNFSTALIEGGEFLVNADPKKFDISAGFGIHIDVEEFDKPVATKVAWNAITDITPASAGFGPLTYVMLDINANVIQKNTLSPEDIRNYILLGEVQHVGTSDVTNLVDYSKTPQHNVGAWLADLAEAVGDMNVSGNQYGPAGLLTLNRTAGDIYKIGDQMKTNNKNPSHVTTSLDPAVSFVYVFRNSINFTEVQNNTDIAPGLYDDGTNTGANIVPNGTVAPNSWTIQRIYIAEGDVTVVQYGQLIYGSASAAEDGIRDEVDVHPLLRTSSILRGWLLVRGAGTDLAISGDAKFLHAGKFGEIGNTGSSSGISSIGESASLTLTDPAQDTLTTLDVDSYETIVLHTTTTANNQEIPLPTNPGKSLVLLNRSDSTDPICVLASTSVTSRINLDPGQSIYLKFDGVAWTIELPTNIIKSNLSTHWLTGGTLSVNGGDTTLFDITSGTGIVVDNSDVTQSHIKQVSWSSGAALTVTNLATDPVSFIYVDESGSIMQKTSLVDDITDSRSLIFLGELHHPGNTVLINTVNYTTTPPTDVALWISDLAKAIGRFTISGNVFGPNGSNLSIDKSAGKSYSHGVNAKSSFTTPSLLTLAGLTATVFASVFRDGAGDFNTVPPTNPNNAAINPGVYDDGTVVTPGQPLPNGTVGVSKYTIQRMWTTQTNLPILHYGQVVYNSLSDAIVAVSEPVEDAPALSGLLFAGWLIVRGNATDLSNPTHAKFITASKFGSAGTTTATIDHHNETILSNGTLSVSTGTYRWYAGANHTITSVRAFVQTAPVGADLIVNVLKNDVLETTITVPDGIAYTLTQTESIQVTAGDYITVDITQVGSTTPGSDLSVKLEYK